MWRRVVKMEIISKIHIQLPSAAAVKRQMGIDPTGAAQRFLMAAVKRRIARYMPYRTGATIKLMQAQTSINEPYIVVDAPYAKYLYYGKAMNGPPPKTVTDRDLVYTKTKNPQAGPFWDRRMMAAEGIDIVQELQNFIDKRG